MRSVRIDYSVKDVIGEEEKRQRLRDYGLRRQPKKKMNPLDLFKDVLQPAPQQLTRPKTAGPTVQPKTVANSSLPTNRPSTGTRKSVQLPAEQPTTNISDDRQEVNKAGGALFSGAGLMQSPVPGKRRPSSGNPVCRVNPLSKVAPSPPKWDKSSVCPNRALLVMEQDAQVEKFRTRHPDQYPDHVRDTKVEPNLTYSSSRIKQKKRASFDRKNRYHPGTVGVIVNHDLPFYPELKERANHGIHNTRWAVGTRAEDSAVDWAKPAKDPHHRSREKFWKEFAKPEQRQAKARELRLELGSSLEEGMYAGPVSSSVGPGDGAGWDGGKKEHVEVYRHVSSFATVASRRSQPQR